MKKFAVFVVAILIMACNNPQYEKDLFLKNDSLTVKISYYPNGEDIHLKKQFLHDTMKHGYSIQFYKSGQKEMQLKYQRGKKHGAAKIFYKDGTLKHIEHWQDGELNGISKWFYKNGKLKEKASYEDGNKAGPAYLYDKDENLKTYKYYNNYYEDGSKARYKVTYNEQGEVTEEKGTGIPILFRSHEDTLSVGDTLEVTYYPIDPPHANGKTLYGADGNVGEDIFVDKEKLKIRDGKAKHRMSWNKPGAYKVGVKLFIETENENAQKEFGGTTAYYVIDTSSN